MSYAELCCKTNHSFLIGASHPEELMERAHQLGLAALAITDRDGVYGMPKAYRAWKNLAGQPHAPKLIVGAELTLSGRPRVTLLAQDRRAYGLLCRMITASHAGKPKGQAALAWDEFLALVQRPGHDSLIALGHDPDLKELFGERLFIPLSRHLDGLDGERTRSALELSSRLGARIVATNDVHYHVPGRARLQDLLTSIREGMPLDAAGRRLFSNRERYLKAPAEMARLFRDLPEALASTLEIAGRCVFSPAELRYHYPSEWIPAGETAQSYLEKLTREGARKRYPEGVPAEVELQLARELKLIAELAFADYFLTIWEIVEFARSRGILCQGRGSAANSAVCYVLGITAVDPVRMNLLFERFLSAERGEPPDIDVDFEHERREEVIQHVYSKYGRDRAAMVAAVITYRSRSARREVNKAFGLSPVDSGDKTVDKFVEEIYGFPRHLSIHSGGFTLSRDPLIETVPVEPARMEGRTIVQWDKDDLDAIGLLKVDLLSLGMLSAIRKTCDAVGLPFVSIPPEDPATYEMMCRGDTVGVFQIESRAQMNMLGRLRPRTFYDLVIQVAIVRPGPIVGKMVHPYLKRRRGLESSKSPHPALEPILAKTLGVPLFQEQVMKIAIALAGFTPGEADELRRAIGAWRSSGSIEKMGAKLMKGLLKSGLPREWVERVFQQIKGFAEYGFPESHAASFALLAYASSYLKRHHPAQFTCALLNSLPMGFYAPHTLIEDARRHGVRVLPVHPNLSGWNSAVAPDGALRVGLRAVKGLAETDAHRLLDERARGGAFRGLADFLARARLGRNVLDRLAMGDAFACFGLSQREALWQILAHAAAGDLFSNAESPQAELFEKLSEYEAIRADYASYRLSTRGHPMRALRAAGRDARVPKTTTGAARAAAHDTMASVAGLVIVRQRPSTAGGTIFAALEDEEGFLDLILRESVYRKYEEIFINHSFLVARGRLQRDGHSVSMLVNGIKPLWPENPRNFVRSHDWC